MVVSALFLVVWDFRQFIGMTEDCSLTCSIHLFQNMTNLLYDFFLLRPILFVIKICTVVI